MPEFIRRYYESDRPIELRPVELGRYFGQKIDDGRIHVWIRTAAKLPDDPALHMCALAYASDFSLLDAVMARYGRTLFDKRMMPASLDHAMWFHRPFRADEWLLYAQDSPSAQDGRGLDPRPDLQARRHAGGVGGAGRLGAPAQVSAASARCTRQRASLRRPARIATRTSCAYQRSTHGIGMMKMQAIANTMVRHRHFQAGAVEDDFAPRAVDVAANPAHPGRDTQAQPMMVMTEMYSSRCQPI